MAGRHRQPSLVKPLIPVATGATVTVLMLLTGTAMAEPVVKPTARAVQLPEVHLTLPPLDVASAAMYLTPLPSPRLPAPDPETSPQTVRVTAPKPFTITTTGSGRVVRAVSAAMGMLGTRYVYGGTSRSGVDCSGLTQLAFRAAGVSLPRTAAAQSTVGRSVSLSQVQAGDLLFFYAPIEHVVMSTGNGMIVEASQPGVPVHQVPLYTNGLVSVRRIIG